MPDKKHVNSAGAPDPNVEVHHNEHTGPAVFHGHDKAMQHSKDLHRGDRPGTPAAAPAPDTDNDGH